MELLSGHFSFKKVKKSFLAKLALLPSSLLVRPQPQKRKHQAATPILQDGLLSWRCSLKLGLASGRGSAFSSSDPSCSLSLRSLSSPLPTAPICTNTQSHYFLFNSRGNLCTNVRLVYTVPITKANSKLCIRSY